MTKQLFSYTFSFWFGRALTWSELKGRCDPV